MLSTIVSPDTDSSVDSFFWDFEYVILVLPASLVSGEVKVTNLISNPPSTISHLSFLLERFFMAFDLLTRIICPAEVPALEAWPPV